MSKRSAVILGVMGMSVWLGCQPVPKTGGNPVMGDHVASGKALYTKHCAACHGQSGKGSASPDFQPPPADLTSAKVQTQLAPQLIRTVHEGRPNSAMGTWNQVLSDQAIEDVVAYLRVLRE